MGRAVQPTANSAVTDNSSSARVMVEPPSDVSCGGRDAFERVNHSSTLSLGVRAERSNWTLVHAPHRLLDQGPIGRRVASVCNGGAGDGIGPQAAGVPLVHT